MSDPKKFPGPASSPKRRHPQEEEDYEDPGEGTSSGTAAGPSTAPSLPKKLRPHEMNPVDAAAQFLRRAIQDEIETQMSLGDPLFSVSGAPSQFMDKFGIDILAEAASAAGLIDEATGSTPITTSAVTSGVSSSSYSSSYSYYPHFEDTRTQARGPAPTAPPAALPTPAAPAAPTSPAPSEEHSPRKKPRKSAVPVKFTPQDEEDGWDRRPIKIEYSPRPMRPHPTSCCIVITDSSDDEAAAEAENEVGSEVQVQASQIAEAQESGAAQAEAQPSDTSDAAVRSVSGSISGSGSGSGYGATPLTSSERVEHSDPRHPDVLEKPKTPEATSSSSSSSSSESEDSDSSSESKPSTPSTPVPKKRPQKKQQPSFEPLKVRSILKTKCTKFNVPATAAKRGRVKMGDIDRMFRATSRSLEYKHLPFKAAGIHEVLERVIAKCKTMNTTKSMMMIHYTRTYNVKSAVEEMRAKLGMLCNLSISTPFTFEHTAPKIHTPATVRNISQACENGVKGAWDVKEQHHHNLCPRSSDFRTIIVQAATPCDFLQAVKECLPLVYKFPKQVCIRTAECDDGGNLLPIYDECSSGYALGHFQTPAPQPELESLTQAIQKAIDDMDKH
ncbi:regulatory protein IE2 [Aotine betaherpesvirus 1]|uniref:Regulatory protein IE2 n=1 Tax=Aotine betaherpesvirus 1 TaxID=50290 RepID=G8XUH9_9BETA|nr:regulatory protein IE2 [Aotine betaherpesvirus 1]AEV80809.1 regulatory protein IE2 [Aotine betaherpesvirus 1]